jgi:DNA modification methylase
MKTKILTGDVRQVLTRQPAASFDACLCDPPYGLSFMGKAWDHGVPGSEVWAEVLRVLKPGAPLMAFGGTRTFHRLACAIEDAGFAISDTLCWLYGQGFPKGHAQLKPAWEPIILAWKKGPRVLAIDACRIGSWGGVRSVVIPSRAGLSVNAFGDGLNNTRGVTVPGLGRWPANVILDAEASAALDLQSGESRSTSRVGKRAGRNDGLKFAMAEQPEVQMGHSDSGGASRFFYCAKASKSERGEGNTHPTVKPIKLIEYLAKLILPPERDTPRRLLIPFSGSGSEMLGARKAGWDEITGIEISREYAAIAASRLKAA